MNPQHTIPTMKDGEFCMNESRAAATYIIRFVIKNNCLFKKINLYNFFLNFSKYGKDDKLYPKDVVTRAIVDQRLYFDMGTFYKAIGDVMVCT